MRKSIIDNNDGENKELKTCATLSGFLNVTDGFIKLDNVLTIISTNYIDRIDDAVLRHGRIDLKIELKKMLIEYANKLIYNYFGENIKEGIITNYSHTPSQVKNYCKFSKTVEELECNLLKNA